MQGNNPVPQAEPCGTFFWILHHHLTLSLNKNIRIYRKLQRTNCTVEYAAVLSIFNADTDLTLQRSPRTLSSVDRRLAARGYFDPCSNVFCGENLLRCPMTIERGVRIIAGTMVLISVALAVWVSQWWLILAAFVGLNLIQSAFTGFCPAEKIVGRCGLTHTNQA